MKILLISNKSPWPPKDGGSSATLNMIRGLISAGASVSVLAMNTSKHRTDPGNIPADLKGILKLVPADTGINPARMILNLLFSDKPYTLERFRREHFSKAVGETVRDSFDIIQVEGLAMAGYLPLIRTISAARIIFRPHNVENLIWYGLAREEANPLKSLYYRITASRTAGTEAAVMNSFDGVAAMTSSDLEWFTARGLKVPSVISAPGVIIPEEAEKIHIPGSVFFIGALDWRPNISGLKWFINRVWPGVLRSVPEASFHIAGRNPSPEAKKICRGKGVVFHGEVESSAAFMKGKDLMVVPLFSGSGIRMKILEGMSLGKCIVATTRAAEGMEYKDSENIWIADDPGTFAERIISLLRNEDARKTTGDFAMENVRKNYNILASAEKMLKFYILLP